MSELTCILSAVEAGDPQAASQLLPLVYDELRRLAAAHGAREKPRQTLDATALVHEAWMRLTGGQHLESRRHFFRAYAEAMRRILVEPGRNLTLDRPTDGVTMSRQTPCLATEKHRLTNRVVPQRTPTGFPGGTASGSVVSGRSPADPTGTFLAPGAPLSWQCTR